MVTVHWLRHRPFQKFLGLYWWSSMQTTTLLPAYRKKDRINIQQSLKCHLFGENSWYPMIVVVFDIAGDVSLNGRPETFYLCTVGGPWLKIRSLLAKVVVLERLLGPWNQNKHNHDIIMRTSSILPGVWKSSLTKVIVVGHKSFKICFPQLINYFMISSVVTYRTLTGISWSLLYWEKAEAAPSVNRLSLFKRTRTSLNTLWSVGKLSRWC